MIDFTPPIKGYLLVRTRKLKLSSSTKTDVSFYLKADLPVGRIHDMNQSARRNHDEDHREWKNHPEAIYKFTSANMFYVDDLNAR